MTELRYRRPTEADHPALVTVVDDWWGGGRIRALLPRLWLRHFAGTSWLAETADGRLAGFLVGFLGQDRPDEAAVHLAAVNPNLRRRGIGRELYRRFVDDMRSRGARRVTTVAWPGNRGAVAFHRAIGFEVRKDGATPIYGTPAYPDYDAPGEDRVILERPV